MPVPASGRFRASGRYCSPHASGHPFYARAVAASAAVAAFTGLLAQAAVPAIAFARRRSLLPSA